MAAAISVSATEYRCGVPPTCQASAPAAPAVQTSRVFLDTATGKAIGSISKDLKTASVFHYNSLDEIDYIDQWDLKGTVTAMPSSCKASVSSRLAWPRMLRFSVSP